MHSTEVNIMAQHYEDKTQHILVDHVTPFMNSLPYNKMLLGNKKIKKELRQHSNVSNLMNIAFEKPQNALTIGDTVTWSLDGIDVDVVVLSHDRMFIKGRYVWAVTVAIID